MMTRFRAIFAGRQASRQASRHTVSGASLDQATPPTPRQASGTQRLPGGLSPLAGSSSAGQAADVSRTRTAHQRRHRSPSGAASEAAHASRQASLLTSLLASNQASLPAPTPNTALASKSGSDKRPGSPRRRRASGSRRFVLNSCWLGLGVISAGSSQAIAAELSHTPHNFSGLPARGHEGHLPLRSRSRFPLAVNLSAPRGAHETLDAYYLSRFKAVLSTERSTSGLLAEGLTGFIARYEGDRSALLPQTRATIDALLTPHATNTCITENLLEATFDTDHFRLTYFDSGVDMVPMTDSDGTGVPDFIEKAAQYLEYSWRYEVDELGFQAPLLPPDTGRMKVTFQDLGVYGYANCPSGLCELVIENDFDGFPENDDPEGLVAGASKVTIAHEFKHTLQYEVSQWSEYDWIELDATWMEDIVFPQVNDYVGYVNQGHSQVVSPDETLTKGGSGTYDDAIWQHSMSERFGTQILVELWDRRMDSPEERMLTSYDETLKAYGSNLSEHFTQDYMLRNYFTGDRAVVTSVPKYTDAALFTTAPAPALTRGSEEILHLQRLSGEFLSVTDTANSRPTIAVNATVRTGLGVHVVSWLKSGSVVVQAIPWAESGANVTLPHLWSDLKHVDILIGNGGSSARRVSVQVN